jgi:hypothetical protein
VVQNQPGEIVHRILSWKKKITKRAGEVAQGIGPELKPQYCKKKKKKKKKVKLSNAFLLQNKHFLHY